MQKITPFLWFDNNADEAMHFYTSIFKNSQIKDVSRYPDNHPEFAGKLMTGTFVLEGQEFMALNGGPMFKFTEAISMFVRCETQDEIDYYSSKLADQGTQEQCGWITDKFGLSWQIVPTCLGELLSNPDPVKANKVLQAMLQMQKLDIQVLKDAANS